MGTLALLSINGKSQSTMYRRERSESNAIIRKHSITETAMHLTSENSNMLWGSQRGKRNFNNAGCSAHQALHKLMYGSESKIDDINPLFTHQPQLSSALSWCKHLPLYILVHVDSHTSFITYLRCLCMLVFMYMCV